MERDYYKLRNNSLYGKTVENVRKRRDIRIATNEDKYVTYVSKPSFMFANRIAENIIFIELEKEQVVLDKPVYVGFSVLE